MQIRQAVEAAPPTSLPSSRRSRGPWAPSSAGPYTLPREIAGRLIAALTDFRNRDAAFALAVFLARHWSAPMRLLMAFPIDRRALTDHEALGLTEGKVRGAISTLEKIGFVDRDLVARGSPYRATEAGLHRKPVMWRFGSDYGATFAQVNRRTRTAKRSPATDRRPIVASPSQHPRMPETKLAQKESPPGRVLLMGELQKVFDPGLEGALARLGMAVGKVRR